MPRYSSYQGTSANTRTADALNPDSFRIDERTTTDLLNEIRRIAANLRYYNASNQPDGDWADFFLSDESFLLADILAYNLHESEDRRLSLISSFDSFADPEQRLTVWSEFFEMLWSMLVRIDTWYQRASGFNRQRESTPLENELSGAIDSVLRPVLNKLLSIYDKVSQSGFRLAPIPDTDSLSAIWKPGAEPEEVLFENEESQDALLTQSLKQFMLLYRIITRAIHGLQARAPGLFHHSLEHNDAHAPHIGLLLAFLDQFKLVQEDMNGLTERHLQFYFQDLLGQRPARMTPDLVHLIVRLSEKSKDVVLPAGLIASAGQDAEGKNLLFEVRDTVRMSQVKIGALYTLFVSREPLIDYFTRYRLVSGLYCDTPLVGLPSETSEAGWATLGEEQIFRSEGERSMQDASIGFALSSSALLMGSGVRDVALTFRVQPASLEQLTFLVTDIANHRKLRPDEVFQEVFATAFDLFLTTEDGWHPVDRYEVSLAEEMNNTAFSITFSLGQAEPAIVRYTPTTHGYDLQATQPVLKAHLRQGGHFFGYSFIEPLVLEDIHIKVSVSNVGNLRMFNRFGPLDLNGPVQFLGPMPEKGSYFLLGHEELFCKQLSGLEIGWEYQPFPGDTRDLGAYFSAYGQGVTTDSYRLEMTARTDYQFSPTSRKKRQETPLFDISKDGLLVRERTLRDIDLKRLGIHPDYQLKAGQLDNYSRDSRTGFLRFELVDPIMGFGFEAFPGVFSAAVTANAAQGSLLKGETPKVPLPNNPFAPTIDAVTVNYQAEDILVFEESRLLENAPESGSEFYLYHPFGVSRTMTGGKSHSRKIIPTFPDEGYLFLGLSDIGPGQEVNLLFDLVPGGAWEMGVIPTLEWKALVGSEWKPLSAAHVLSDETRGLMETGILRIKLPSGIKTNAGAMPGGLLWLCAAVTNKASMISRTRDIHTNALVAAFKPAESQMHAPLHLPPGRIRDFASPVQGVINVSQPLESYGGRMGENRNAYYNRVSERLRHKNRALTRWDIERLLLQKFDWLAQAKCVGPWGSGSLVEHGSAVVVALPRLSAQTARFEPNLNRAEISILKEYLAELSNPFSEITVRNPTYEYLRIKCKVNLKGDHHGILLEQLQEDLRRFISPWLFSGAVNASLGGTIQVTELLGCIQSLSYVNYVTGFSVVHLQTDQDGRVVIRDSADPDNPYDTIRGGTPWSVFLLHTHNDLSVITDYAWQEPAMTALSDLRIGEDLVIAGEGSAEGEESGEETKQKNKGTDDKEHSPLQITIQF